MSLTRSSAVGMGDGATSELNNFSWHNGIDMRKKTLMYYVCKLILCIYVIQLGAGIGDYFWYTCVFYVGDSLFISQKTCQLVGNLKGGLEKCTFQHTISTQTFKIKMK